MSNDIVKPKMTYGDTLRFTAYAYAKLLYMRDRGDTEVAGYGITGTEDPFLITDFRLIKQKCSSVSFDLDTNDGVEFLEEMMDAGLMPWQVSNILLHSHPGNCPSPSSTDETNFNKAFSHPDWAVMFIIAKDGSTYCRLKVNAGPGAERELETTLDWDAPFGRSDVEEWDAEYKDKVTVEEPIRMTGKEFGATRTAFSPNNLNEHPWWDGEDQEAVGFAPNQQVEEQEEDEDEFDCFWDTNGDVVHWDEKEHTYYTYDPLNHLWYKDSDEENGTIEQIEIPKEPWVPAVIAWADKYADERNVTLIEEEVCDSGKEG